MNDRHKITDKPDIHQLGYASHRAKPSKPSVFDLLMMEIRDFLWTNKRWLLVAPVAAVLVLVILVWGMRWAGPLMIPNLKIIHYW